MPKHRSDMLSAMQSELLSIPDEKLRREFAFGCFVAALSEWCKSRRGLSIIARVSGAILLTLLSAFAFFLSHQIELTPESISIATIITNLSVVYLIAAILLITSLQALRGLAILGVLLALPCWAYFTFFENATGDNLVTFYSAISIEVVAIMALLFFGSTYLNWLYSPECHDN